MRNILAAIGTAFRRNRAPSGYSVPNGDGTATQSWTCGCEYLLDSTTGRILSETVCERHQTGEPA